MPHFKNLDNDVRKLNNEFFRALDKCVNTLTLNELSRVSGVRIELLRRYVDRRVKLVRAETWDKIYPVLKPYLEGPEPPLEPPPRIGAPYRRHAELVEMTSDQKVLLDVFAVFKDSVQKQIVDEFMKAAAPDATATVFTSLSALENRLMGAYLAMDKETKEQSLSKWTLRATAELRRRRAELF